MGSKQSIKSKSNHVVRNETRIFHDREVEWTGEGVYIHHIPSTKYVQVFEMHDLAYKLRHNNPSWGEVVYLDDDNTRT